MRLGLHTYSDDRLMIKLEIENETEREIVDFLIGKCGSNKEFKGSGDSHNGLFIDTGKKLK